MNFESTFTRKRQTPSLHNGSYSKMTGEISCIKQAKQLRDKIMNALGNTT